MLAACGNSGIPDEHGVYARTHDGELIRLDKAENVYNTDAVYIGSFTDKQNFNYITSKPETTIDLYDIEGFIIYGEQPLGTDVLIKYFTDFYEMKKKTKLRLSNNTGPGDVDENTFIDYHFGCGEVDGGSFKKIEENMYLFTFPQTESSDYKYCSLAMHKEMGGKKLPRPYVSANFFGWYYDNTYWTFNVKNEDAAGKKNELARLAVLENEKQKIIAYNKQQQERIKRYNNAPVITNFTSYLEPIDLIKLASKDLISPNGNFKVEQHNNPWWLTFGASRTVIKTNGLNKFELDSFIKEANEEAKKVYDDLRSSELKGEVVRLTGLNLPVKLSTSGTITASYQDIINNITYKMGKLKSVKLKEQVNTLSPYLADIMSSDERDFKSIIRLDMLGYDEYRQSGFRIKLKPKDYNLIKKIGEQNGGKDVITEVTLEFHDASFMMDSFWKSDLYEYQISSFKLKSANDYTFLIHPKASRSPSDFLVFNKEGIQL